jgi:hypothetical protein
VCAPTLTIVRTTICGLLPADICGNVKLIQFQYNADGASSLTRIDVPVFGGGDPVPVASPAPRNSAGHGGRAGFMATGSTLVGAALMILAAVL